MKVLLDTHAILFSWMDPDKLSPRARELISDPANDVIFSQVSSLEICIKHRIGKLPLPDIPERYLPSRIQRFGMQYIPLEDADIFGLQSIPDLHRDPFDWLLVSIARRLQVPLVSRDSHLSKYPVTLLW